MHVDVQVARHVAGVLGVGQLGAGRRRKRVGAGPSPAVAQLLPGCSRNGRTLIIPFIFNDLRRAPKDHEALARFSLNVHRAHTKCLTIPSTYY